MESDAVCSSTPNWIRIQEELSLRASATAAVDISKVRLVGGCDITFSMIDPEVACTCIVVYDIVRRECVLVKDSIDRIDVPFVPGFLAFREVPTLLRMWQDLKKASPELFPEVILLDGNGIMHTRKCGVATHLGVELSVPTIGVAKTYFQVGDLDSHLIRQFCRALTKRGQWFRLVDKAGFEWGAVLRVTAEENTTEKIIIDTVEEVDLLTSTGDSVLLESSGTAVDKTLTNFKPIFVSVGYQVSLEQAVVLVANLCIHRVPEPIRIADKHSRAEISKRGV